MNESDHVRTAVSALVRSTVDQLHREEHFTMRLFALLWPQLGERILGTTGLSLASLLQNISGTDTDRLRQTFLPKTKDFYADLLITAPLGNVRLKSTMSITDVLEQIPITHIYEFKYLTSFATLSPKKGREDAYKLLILGKYIQMATGRLPHMQQFIVASKREAKRMRSVTNLLAWFPDEEVASTLRNVEISIIDTEGVIHNK